MSDNESFQQPAVYESSDEEQEQIDQPEHKRVPHLWEKARTFASSEEARRWIREDDGWSRR